VSNPTIDVRCGEELDIPSVDAYLKAHIEGLIGVPAVRQFPSGASNLTYLLSYQGRDLVLRRPPTGTRPKSGHSMIREYSVMKALKPLFPAVPTVLLHEPDEGLMGAEFYVMERVVGDLIHDRIPDDWGFDEGDARKLSQVFWDKLIELHDVDYQAAGLADFGKPAGYVERQILGWNGRYELAKTDDVDAFEDVRNWLADNMPPESGKVSILHGDFRIDNVILDPHDHFNILAVLDWEISALGDPLMDLGNTLAYWIEADDPPGIRALSKQPSAAPGMMKRDEIVDYYCSARGLDVGNVNYYMTYGVFRLAVILQQIYYRYYHGQTKNQMFKMFGHSVNELGNHCRRLIERG